MSSWYIGAIINVVGSILINLGTNVMKLGHNKRSADLPESSRQPIRKYREWQCGVVLFVIGNALNFVSFGFAAQSLLAALGSIQFVSNVFFAWFVLHERADRRVIMATAMIVVGCIVLVAFGNHQSKPLTSHQLQHYFQNDVYIAYLSWLLTSAGIAYIVYRIGSRKLKREGLGGMSHRWMKALPISYSLFSGMIGTQSVLFSKALSTLLRTTIDGHSQLGSWFFWLVLLLFLCCAYFWVTSLNKALRLFPAVVIVPTMQISWTLFSVVSGGIYYQEYHAFTAFTASMFGLGVLIIFVGVYLLSGSSAHEQITPAPVPGCPDTQCDPESLCVSQRRTSRPLSALALPGFGYMPGFFSNAQLASPRYVTLKDQSDMTCSPKIARYNSVPALTRLQPASQHSLPAASDDAGKACIASALARGQSVPTMIRPFNQAHSLSSESVLSPQSPLSAHSLQSPQSTVFSSRPTTAADVDLLSPHWQSPAGSVVQQRTAATLSMDSEQAQLHSDSVPMLGAFAPVAFRLQSTTSDVLAQLLDTMPGFLSQTDAPDEELPESPHVVPDAA